MTGPLTEVEEWNQAWMANVHACTTAALTAQAEAIADRQGARTVHGVDYLDDLVAGGGGQDRITVWVTDAVSQIDERLNQIVEEISMGTDPNLTPSQLDAQQYDADLRDEFAADTQARRQVNKNLVLISGRLLDDPELRVQDNRSVAAFRLGIKPGLWVNVGVWDDLAEVVADRRHEGDQVLISGELISKISKDANGNHRYYLCVTADMVGLQQ